MRHPAPGTLLTLLVLLAVGCLCLATALGSVTHTPADWWYALTHPASREGELLWRLRIPRAAAAFTRPVADRPPFC